jgi:hypothetical protein
VPAFAATARRQQRRHSPDSAHPKSAGPQLFDLVVGLWRGREDRYSELRAALHDEREKTKVEMSFVGG